MDIESYRNNPQTLFVSKIKPTKKKVVKKMFKIQLLAERVTHDWKCGASKRQKDSKCKWKESGVIPGHRLCRGVNAGASPQDALQDNVVAPTSQRSPREENTCYHWREEKPTCPSESPSLRKETAKTLPCSLREQEDRIPNHLWKNRQITRGPQKRTSAPLKRFFMCVSVFLSISIPLWHFCSQAWTLYSFRWIL